MKKIFVFAGNITYKGFTYNSRLRVEYAHTGKLYYQRKGHKTLGDKYAASREIAEDLKAKGKKIQITSGYWFIDRIAIITGNDYWYITNDGDTYSLNKASKFWQKHIKNFLKNSRRVIYNTLRIRLLRKFVPLPEWITGVSTCKGRISSFTDSQHPAHSNTLKPRFNTLVTPR